MATERNGCANEACYLHSDGGYCRICAPVYARGFEACRAAALGVAHDASTLEEARDDIRALSPTADTGGGGDDLGEALRLLESAAFRFEYISTKPFEDNDIGHCEYMVNEIRAFLASRTGVDR